MQSNTVYSRPLGPDLAIVAGFIQVGLALAFSFLPFGETCVGFASLEPGKLKCTYDSFFAVYGFSLAGPVLGLVVLLATGCLLMAGSQLGEVSFPGAWPWLAVAMNGVGLLLAWKVVLWFVPTVACALWAALVLRGAHGLRGGLLRLPWL